MVTKDTGVKGLVKLTVLNRGLINVPVWERHERGRNWAATIKANPQAPGGLERAWWNQARGMAAEIFKYVVPETVATGDVVEFGADYYTYGGNKHPRRWYGVVAMGSEDALYIVPCETALHAFTMAADIRRSFLAPPPAPGAEPPGAPVVEVPVPEEGEVEG